MHSRRARAARVGTWARLNLPTEKTKKMEKTEKTDNTLKTRNLENMENMEKMGDTERTDKTDEDQGGRHPSAAGGGRAGGFETRRHGRADKWT
jgi:hypothetical protein